MVSAWNSFADPLTEPMLLGWHAALLSHEPRMEVGRWRSHAEPMQIVSGGHCASLLRVDPSFEDGNGRMGRVLAEKALAQTIGCPNLTSLSITIERNKKSSIACSTRDPRDFRGE